MHGDLAGVAVDDLGLLLRVGDNDDLGLGRSEQVPGGEGTGQAALAVLPGERDQLLALRTEQGAGDPDLERLGVETDRFAEIDEVSERFLALCLDSGHSDQPLGGRIRRDHDDRDAARACRAPRRSKRSRYVKKPWMWHRNPQVRLRSTARGALTASCSADRYCGAVTSQTIVLLAHLRRISVRSEIRMAVLITWRPSDDQGIEDLAELERQTHKHAIRESASRRYYLADAEFGAFTSMLDRIDPAWHDHLETWYQGPAAAARLPRV